MSCFESSTFLKNPLIMDKEILQKACETLKWRYELKMERQKEVLYVYDVNQKTSLHKEFALKVIDNQVTYNSYYLKNGKELAQELASTFMELNAEYAKETVRKSFEDKGFKYMNDFKFSENETEKYRFFMVGHSRLAGETEKRTEIQFTILKDGTIVSDSNYIPKDVHDWADAAMENIDAIFGSKRIEGTHIKRKEIPLKYKDKAYCSPKDKITIK